MSKKSFYEAPEAELLDLRIEENFCGTTYNDAGTGYSGNDLGDLDDEGN